MNEKFTLKEIKLIQIAMEYLDSELPECNSVLRRLDAMLAAPAAQGEPIPARFALIKLDSRTGKPLVTSEMKVKHIGEYWWDEEAPYYDEHGDLHDYVARHAVPWSLCKEIYKSMASTAMLSMQPAEQQPAPAVQGEPVAAPDMTPWEELDFSKMTRRQLVVYSGQQNFKITHLQAHNDHLSAKVRRQKDALRQIEQQPAPDVTQLVDALCRCLHQANYSIGCEDALKAQLEKVREIANNALAAYHKQGVRP